MIVILPHGTRIDTETEAAIALDLARYHACRASIATDEAERTEALCVAERQRHTAEAWHSGQHWVVKFCRQHQRRLTEETCRITKASKGRARR